jgi:hypothetical protein
MIRKSLAFLLIGFVFVIAGDAQTPAPGAKGESRSCSLVVVIDGGDRGVQPEEVTQDKIGK